MELLFLPGGVLLGWLGKSFISSLTKKQKFVRGQIKSIIDMMDYDHSRWRMTHRCAWLNDVGLLDISVACYKCADNGIEVFCGYLRKDTPFVIKTGKYMFKLNPIERLVMRQAVERLQQNQLSATTIKYIQESSDV